MTRFIKSTFQGLLVVGLGASTLFAQGAKNDFGLEMKVRGGITQGSPSDWLHNQKLMGLGFEGSIPLSGQSRLVLEGTYTYLPGGDYDNMPAATFDGKALSASSSADRRKLSLEGFGVRAAYRAPLTGELNWQVGVALNQFRAKEEVSGTIRPTGVTSSGYESLQYTPSSSKLCPSVFAGLKYGVNEAVSLELNVVNLGFNTVKWQPYWYTGVNANSGTPYVGKSSTGNQTGLAIEFAIGLRL